MGSTVLVQDKTKNGEFHSAVVADEENGLFDIIYDDNTFRDEEMVVASRLVLLVQECSPTATDLQQVPKRLLRSLYIIITFRKLQ